MPETSKVCKGKLQGTNRANLREVTWATMGKDCPDSNDAMCYKRCSRTQEFNFCRDGFGF